MKTVVEEAPLLTEAGNVTWLQLHTGKGLIGLGKNLRNPDSLIACIHPMAVSASIGKSLSDEAVI